MAAPSSQSPRRSRAAESAVRWLAVLTLSAPLVVMAAVLGVRFGGWSLALGYDLLTLTVGRVLAYAGLAAALAAVVLARADLGRRGAWAALAVIVAGGSVAAYAIQDLRLATPAPQDATTDLAETPGFSRLMQERRGRVELTARPQSCAGVRWVPTQVAPETAAQALRDAGFQVVGAAAFRAEGVREGFFFGFAHDAVIRIRPARTDVRVVARDGRAQGDQACRLAERIVRGLAG